MARRSSTKDSTESNQSEATSAPTSEEAAVTADTSTAAPAATEAPAAPKPEINLDAFRSAVDTAVAERDTSTGTVSEAGFAPVNEQYRALDGIAAKNAAKKVLQTSMREAMDKMDIGLARSYMDITDKLAASGGSSAPKAERVPVDPTEALVTKVAALNLAVELVEVPEGVSDDWTEQVEKVLGEARGQLESYRAFLADTSEDKTEPEGILPVVKLAFKAAQGKALGKSSTRSGTPYTGDRRNIGTHITEAFAGQESGAFLKVSEIRGFKSNEYGDNPPSAGAISARLFPKSGKCTVEGIEPGTNADGDRGATKV